MEGMIPIEEFRNDDELAKINWLQIEVFLRNREF